MYSDEETLEQYKLVWLTRETNKLLQKEKTRLWEKEKRKISKAKILNNLILEKYATLPKVSKK